MKGNHLIPVDLVEIIREDLRKDKRDPDGLLHASSDLHGSLRHIMLNYVGAPKIERSITEDIRTKTGWFWHDHLGELLVECGVPVMREVNLTPWMPEGWSGTADWLFWSPQYQAFVLGDLKTTKGEAIKYRTHEGMSADHWWQLSAYWYACVKMGLPMVKGFGVLYLPMNTKLGEEVEPVLLDNDPVPEEELAFQMNEVKRKCDEYHQSLQVVNASDSDARFWGPAAPLEWYLTDALAPPMERVQKLVWDYKAKHWNVVLFPHWLADFCPYDNRLCDCSEQGSTKVGTWSKDLVYTPRKGYENEVVEVEPDAREIKRRGFGK